MSNSFDSDLGLHIVRPDLGPNSLQSLSDLLGSLKDGDLEK